MKNLIYKELGLATHTLTYLFLGFTLMTFIPGYPILCSAFFVCFGMFQSYQTSRENSDILYSVLLPVRKTDVVKAKFYVAVIFQMMAFALCSLFTIIRMEFLSESSVYGTNALMGANFVFLAFVLIIFATFNLVFIGGFFRTAYNYGKPFIIFIILTFVIIGIAEALHYLPGLGWLNSLGFDYLSGQMIVLVSAFVLYFAGTVIAYVASKKSFEKIDL